LSGRLFDVKIQSLLKDLRFCLGNQAMKFGDERPFVLVLHDIDGWALDHVFELWFSDAQSTKIVRRNWTECSTSRAFWGFDAVIFGYLDIYLRFGFDPSKSIVVVHDPCELFPQIPDWKNSQPDPKRMQVLKSLRGVIVISKEMESILEGYGIKTWLVPTMSRLPALGSEEISPVPAASVSIFKDYPRKNADQLRRLARRGKETGKWDLSLYENPDFNDEDYLKMIDRSPIYVCTSWQEGGPLPAMDVMSRGGVVVTAPVGQVQEIIRDGESGFICERLDDFERILELLFSNSELLMRARRKSLASYADLRSRRSIKNSANQILEKIINKLS
jgi:glycosyltransferase involved in cell wall biosynthesis